jgi:hypothetical protein
LEICGYFFAKFFGVNPVKDNAADTIPRDVYENLLKQYNHLRKAAADLLEFHDANTVNRAFYHSSLRLTMDNVDKKITEIDKGAFNEEQSE